MTTKRLIVLTLLTTLIVAGSGYLAGCVHPHPHYPPHLPRTVWLDDPFYFHGGYYYYYHDSCWHYSRERSGPWYTLPKQYYPNNVQFRDTYKPSRRNERAAQPVPPGHTIVNPGRNKDDRDKPSRGRDKRGPGFPTPGRP